MKSLLLVLLMSALTFAGVAMKGTNQMPGEKQNMEIEISDLGVKMGIKSAKTDQTVIFRKDKFLFWIINNQGKSYVEFTKQDLDNIKAQIAMLQEQMKNMPKAQREMMAQMMGGALPDTDVKTEMVLAKKGQKSGSWKCDSYNVLENGKKNSVLCLTPIKKLGLSIDDFSSLNSLSTYMEDLAKQNKQAEMAKYFSKDILMSKGFPVNVKNVTGDKSEISWTSIAKKNIAASAFDLPAGLKKEKAGM